MDNFLNDALFDMFNTKSHTISPKNNNKIPMDPADILASMFEEEQIKNNANQSNGIHIKNNNKNGMDVDDILQPMVMDMNELIPQNNNNNSIDNKNINNNSEININKLPQNSNSNIIDKTDILLSNLLNENNNNNNGNMIDKDEELLSNLLNENENENILNKSEINNAQNIINSIINKPNNNYINDGDDITGNIQVKINEHNISQPQPQSPLIIEEKKQNNLDIKIDAIENINPYYGNNNKNNNNNGPIINANVPPVPFTAISPKKENEYKFNDKKIDNIDENSNDNETVNALALFEDLEVPNHKIGSDNDGISEDNSNSEQEIEIEPNEKELEEIRKSLANPMMEFS